MNATVLQAAVIGLSLAAVPATAAGKEIRADSKIETVTLYRGQALVTRAVTVPKDRGELTIVVGDLPARVVGSSLGASAADGITIQSVRYRTRAAAAAVSKEVADIDAEIKELNRKIHANNQMIAVLGQKGAFVGKLEDFSATLTKADLAKGQLDLKALTEVTGQVFKLREELAEQRIDLDEKARDLKEQLELLQRKRKELTSKAGKSLREAVIFVSKTTDGPAAVRLSYLVDAANWTPAYNVRLAPDDKKVSVEYLAEVTQTSGEDWTAVKLTLSTATPAMNARSPLLVPFWIALAAGPQKDKLGKGTTLNYILSQSTNIASQRKYVVAWNALGRAPEALEEAGWQINRFAAENQRLELNVDAKAVAAGTQALRATQEGLAVSYALPGQMHLASRNDRQLIQIARLNLPATTYYQAIPLLSSYVYRAAEVENTSALPLLAGRYSSYIGGEFVGRGQLRLVARGQKATIGFGVDTQLRCRRELTEKSDRVVWGSRVQSFRYRLRLENFKGEPAHIRLLDRVPASKSEDVRIKLDKTSDDLSTDEVYLRDDKPRGVLRWDIALPARSAGPRAKDVIYHFEMRYAKDRHVGQEATGLMEKMRAVHGSAFFSM